MWLGCDDLFIIHESIDRRRWAILILALAVPLFVTMVALDFLDTAKTLEDGLKTVAGTLILVGILAAWLQLVTPGDPS